MMKIVIPTILTATILIAGFVAFMPVQQAATVHTTIQASQVQIFRVAQGGALGAAAGDSTYTLTCVTACTVDSLALWATGGDALDITFVRNISFNGVPIAVANVGAPADDALRDLTTGAGVGNVADALRTISVVAPASNLAITPLSLSVPAGGTVVVTVQNSVDADGDATVSVVFAGSIISTTAPTAAFVV